MEAVYSFTGSLWIVAAAVLWEGLLGGGAYVNTYFCISKQVLGTDYPHTGFLRCPDPSEMLGLVPRFITSSLLPGGTRKEGVLDGHVVGRRRRRHLGGWLPGHAGAQRPLPASLTRVLSALGARGVAVPSPPCAECAGYRCVSWKPHETPPSGELLVAHREPASS